jgi:exodeoxyribonuclease VII large subunit
MGRVDRESSTGTEVPDNARTVAQLNEEIESVLDDSQARFPSHVVGEVAEVDEYPFGTFFELRDPEAEPVISCLAWSDAVENFEHDLEAGTTAVVEATVDFYPERGDCQLVVWEYWPLGESKRQQELGALRRRLADDGLFDDERKRPIPSHPGCLGLVTSPTGSAREDVWAAVTERSPRTEVRLHGATVQGEDAVPSLIDGIETLDTDPAVETILVTRGGGSDTDLWSFNAEPLVRCIAACSTPVVVAVGHEDDETLVEEAADARAMTPTEAGVLATTPLEAVMDELESLERRTERCYRALVETELERLERRVVTAHEALEQQVTRRESLEKRTRNLERRVTSAYGSLVETRLDRLETRVERGLAEAELAAESEAASARVARGRLTDIERRIAVAYRTHVDRELRQLEQRIEGSYRELAADERVRAEAVTARRLRIVVVVLLGVILLGGVGVALFVL